MEAISPQQFQLFVEQEIQETHLHPILQYPLVKQILSSFLPGFHRNPGRYAAILGEISQYLLETSNLRFDSLLKNLPEDFRITLYGLKLQLQRQNLQQVGNIIENQKHIFGRWLDEELGYDGGS